MSAPAPGFHHLHLNSMNPDAAIGFYTKGPSHEALELVEVRPARMGLVQRPNRFPSRG